MGGVARMGWEDKVRTYNYSQNRVTDRWCGSEKEQSWGGVGEQGRAGGTDARCQGADAGGRGGEAGGGGGQGEGGEGEAQRVLVCGGMRRL